MTKVSVILPTYNAEKFLEETIDSILAQTCKDFEILVIDDNSKDNTRKIVKSYKDKRIKLINGPQKGLAAALNYGIKKAQGEYIARVDADDTALPTRFEKQIKFLDENPNISVLGTWQEHFEDNKVLGNHESSCTHEEIKVALIFNCDMCHSTLMFRKADFIKNNIQYPEGSPQEDYELWLSIINKLKFANLPEVLGRHRHSAFNITNAKRDILKDYQINLVAHYLKDNLKMKLSQKEKELLHRFDNPLSGKNDREIKQYISRLNHLFEKIEKKNKTIQAFNIKLLRKHIMKNYDFYTHGEGYKYISKYTSVPKIKYKLFDKITVLKIKQIYQDNIYYLFGWLPLFRINKKSRNNKFYLFNIIPLFSISEGIVPNMRVDLYNGGGADNDIIVKNKDMSVSQPDWFKQPGWKKQIGNGRIISSPINLIWQKKVICFRAKGTGAVDLELKSPDIRIEKEKVNYKLDYKKLRIENKSIFKPIQTAWHDKPIRHSFPVEDQKNYVLSFYVRRHIPSIVEIITKLKK